MPARKYFHSPETDRLIQEAYRQFRVYGNRRAIPLCCRKLGWPGHVVKKRAVSLGLSRTRDAGPWSERELQILEAGSHLTDQGLVRRLAAAGFQRTEAAVHLKLRRLRIRSNRDWYSANQLAEAFGVDSHKVTRWIKAGALAAARRGTERLAVQGGDGFVIEHKDVREFALRFPEEYDLAKVEKFWFLDLITGGRICR
jgi:hypothetical protein